MESIIHDNQSNLGSLAQIYFIEVEKMSNKPRIANGRVLSAITISDSAPWKSIYSTRNKSIFTETQEKEGAKVIFSQSVSGYIPRDAETIRENLQSGKNGLFALLIKDSNGVTRLLGTADNPCQFTFSFSTNSNIIGGNGYNYTFFRRSITSAPIYDFEFTTE